MAQQTAVWNDSFHADRSFNSGHPLRHIGPQQSSEKRAVRILEPINGHIAMPGNPHLQQSSERFRQQYPVYESMQHSGLDNLDTLSRGSMYSRQMQPSIYTPTGMSFPGNSYQPSQAFLAHQAHMSMQRSGFMGPAHFQPHYHVDSGDMGSGLINRTLEYCDACKMCGN